MANKTELSAISNHIWQTRYRYKESGKYIDNSIEDTWLRVAKSVAKHESDPLVWTEKFYNTLKDFLFLPGGRIIAGAGTKNEVTLLNCFVMGTIDDSMEGIFENLKEAALTMQAGGGIGYDFSTLRPRGSSANQAGTVSSGPISFMKIWNSMCATILSTGMRRGAMMATLRYDHPDILEFISEKSKSTELKHFNLSVLVTDEFIEKVKSNGEIELKFNNKVYKTISAKELWQQIIENTYTHSEPGVLFIDKINGENNLSYCEQISATNPCGEIPLPPYGACNLGSINLSRFVKNPFTQQAAFDWTQFINLIPTAVRFLDNVIDISKYPLEKQKSKESNSRRLGLGITGLADALVKLNITYDSNEGVQITEKIFETLRDNAYAASIELAKERGSFNEYDKAKYCNSPFIKRLPKELQNNIQRYGIRNSHLLAVAPAGTISLLAQNISSGIEPIFSLEQKRRILNVNGEFETFNIQNAAWVEFNNHKHTDKINFRGAVQVSPQFHLKYLQATQPYVDNSISKTINVSRDITFDDFKEIYMNAYEMGLKGCTTFRPNLFTGSILS